MRTLLLVAFLICTLPIVNAKDLSPKDFVGIYVSEAQDGTVQYIQIKELRARFSVYKCTFIEGNTECENRGIIDSITSDSKFKNYAYMSLMGISGERVPTWTFSRENRFSNYDNLILNDYDAYLDAWYETVFNKQGE